jgi:hypothetical protein
VLPIGPVEATTDITFVNPTGDDVVLRKQPLKGRAAWPGIVRDTHGTIVDWPGWHRDGTVWKKGDDFDWAVGEVDVEFKAGPIADTVIAYPSPSGTCIPTPEGAVGGGTGSPDSPTPPAIDPPETSTAGEAPLLPPAQGSDGLLRFLFLATLAAAGFGFARRRTVQVAELAVHIETAEEFRSRVATMTRTRPAPRSSAPARSRARRA